MAGALGRRVPTDTEHLDKYPLTAATLPTKPTPVVIGINWYEGFDNPVKDKSGHWWIGREGLGNIRGGHCVCLKPKGFSDNTAWWDFYNQGSEGACVGFGVSRLASLLNRKRYFARWIWDRAKEVDEWPDTNPGDSDGTSVRAALSILRNSGHIVFDKRKHAQADLDWHKRQGLTPSLSEGINTYRWALNTDDALQALGYNGLDYVDILNSWGRFYPHLVRMPVTVFDRLLKEDGEIGIVTDR